MVVDRGSVRTRGSIASACTFSERRFFPALHGLGVTGHESDGATNLVRFDRPHGFKFSALA
jgi:hypothetical protein